MICGCQNSYFSIVIHANYNENVYLSASFLLPCLATELKLKSSTSTCECVREVNSSFLVSINTSLFCPFLGNVPVYFNTSWFSVLSTIRSNCTEVFCKKDVLKNFAIFIEKHLPEFFFNKIAGLARNFIKKETPAQVLSCEFHGVFMNNYFEENLRTIASVLWKNGKY